MKEVSIIIPSVSWEPFTEQCISICAALYPQAQIILVLDDTTPVNLSFTNLTILYGQGGFISRKRNIGVKNAQTEFVAFIDSDAFPRKGWLENAFDTLETDLSVGMVGGPNISPVSQEHERNLVGMAARSWLVAGKWNFYKSETSSARYCDNLPSCNLVLRKSLYEQLNGMKEDMELGEDTELCARMIAAGHLVYFNPKAIVYHYDRKIAAYLRQRLVRGAGVYMHIFGNSAQRKNPYTILLLQPLFTLFFWMSLPFGYWWQPWFYIVAVAGGVYASLIILEAFRCSTKAKYIPVSGMLILAGNVLPAFGFIFRAFRILPSLHSFYRNDGSDCLN